MSDEVLWHPTNIHNVNNDTVNLSAVDTDTESEAPTSEFLLRSLRYWASTFSVSLAALSALLSILRMFHPELPTDARTILKTQTHVSTIKMEGGEYYHFGLAKGILSCLKSLILPEQLKIVKVQFNLDGLPLFKSCTLQFCLILAIVNCDYTKHPFLIGLYCGMKKPKCIFEFLKPFIDDLADVLMDGIVYNGQNILVEVSSFVCDAPARAFVKIIKSHNGYSGCDKCVQVGEWQNKMTYPETDAKLRTDSDFNHMIDEDHHLNQKLSPLAGLVKMVTMFPLDYMHLCCLGVTRKLLNSWIRGKATTTRLSTQTVADISEKLKLLSSYTPVEFSWKPRGLSEIDRWKATELRSFMLYTGPVINSCLVSGTVPVFLKHAVVLSQNCIFF